MYLWDKKQTELEAIRFLVARKDIIGWSFKELMIHNLTTGSSVKDNELNYFIDNPYANIVHTVEHGNMPYLVKRIRKMCNECFDEGWYKLLIDFDKEEELLGYIQGGFAYNIPDENREFSTALQTRFLKFKQKYFIYRRIGREEAEEMRLERRL